MPTGIEDQACSTPVVAFDTGGLRKIIDNYLTGALAKPFDPASLSAAISWGLNDSQRFKKPGIAARRHTK